MIKINYWIFIIFIASVLIFNAELNFAHAVDGDIMWEWETKVTGQADTAYGTALHSDKIYYVGEEDQGVTWKVEQRRTDNGGGGAKEGDPIWLKEVNPAAHDSAYDVATDDTGIYVVGTQKNRLNWRVEKRDFSGNVLQQWSNPLTACENGAFKVAVNSTAVYVIGGQGMYCGYYGEPSQTKIRIEKRNKNDLSLVWPEPKYLNLTEETYMSSSSGIAVDETALYTYSPLGNYKERLERRSLETGETIWSVDFQGNGSTYTAVNDIVLLGDYIFFAGAGYEGTYLYKYDKSGNFIWKKNTTVYNVSRCPIRENSIAADSTGIYTAGVRARENWTAFQTACLWSIKKLSLVDGSLIWEGISYGLTGGINVSGDPYAIATDGSAVYVGGTMGPLPSPWRVEKRDGTSGFEPHIKLLDNATLNPVSSLFANDIFKADVSDTIVNTSTIATVSFALDDLADGIAPTTGWTTPYAYATSSGDWDKDAKRLNNKSFSTAGDKEVWVKITDTNGTTLSNFAKLTVAALPLGCNENTCDASTSYVCQPIYFVGRTDCVDKCVSGESCAPNPVNRNWREVKP